MEPLDKAILILSPNIDKVECLYGPYDLNGVDKLRLNMYSDILIKVNFIWSYEEPVGSGARRCITTSHQSNSVFRSFKIEALMRYLTIQVLREPNSIPNNEIVIDVRPVGVIGLAGLAGYSTVNIEEPTLRVESVKHVTPAVPELPEPILYPAGPLPEVSILSPKPTLRSHRFKLFSKEKSKEPNTQGVGHDKRLPDGYIPVGCILVGGVGNTLKILPKGLPGEILRIGDAGAPEWFMPYPPVQLSDESIKKLNEAQDPMVGAWSFEP